MKKIVIAVILLIIASSFGQFLYAQDRINADLKVHVQKIIKKDAFDSNLPDFGAGVLLFAPRLERININGNNELFFNVGLFLSRKNTQKDSINQAAIPKQWIELGIGINPYFKYKTPYLYGAYRAKYGSWGYLETYLNLPFVEKQSAVMIFNWLMAGRLFQTPIRYGLGIDQYTSQKKESHFTAIGPKLQWIFSPLYRLANCIIIVSTYPSYQITKPHQLIFTVGLTVEAW